MDYLGLPAAVHAVAAPTASGTVIDAAWDGIKEILFDDDAKAFVDILKETGVPVPEEDHIGYEVEGEDGDVVIRQHGDGHAVPGAVAENLAD